ncbi:ABC transporter substrate-binding protein [Erwinia psidii]|uniref:ABC transporter substrate-binding protein n=1 Tax=Erwinia psidii TaxID=69224 RepID=A0A3N6S1Q1_9GAMM|nr:ABC transporter substrate-binding protein [Erwinia psidii]MCX8957657.1 ABC transporter substrate-binding protein [Erwinia psidii]MCX8960711.1 ABC transporter substrate-binding protein [Erwinia psidii]MCX8964044.1 ABC transporter substrate-binding protein [Erwinia psidii]RQM39528.1 ABC transporter substrate-binding protein [Erwinia psidii]
MKSLLTGLLAGLMLFSLNAASSGLPLEKPRLTIAVGGKSVLYNLPLTIAERKGYFKEAGLQVEIADFAGGGKALQALVGGSADVVSGAYEHTITLQSKNQYITAFIMTGQAPEIVVAVSRKAIPDYHQISDLKGKKIGISAPGSSTNMVANVLLAKGGLKPGDVSFIGVGTAAGAVDALRAGRIDAIANTEPVISLLEKNHDITVIADTRTVAGTEALFGGPMPAGSLYAKASFLDNNPATVQALTTAMLKALRWLQTASPEEVAAVVPESYLLGDAALYKTAFSHIRPALSRDGLFTQKATETALKALSTFDPTIRPEHIDLSRTWTNRYVTEALRNEQK